MVKKILFIAFLVIFIVSCAAPTKYQPLSHTGGYSDKRQTYIDENIYEVAFYGNGFTSISRTEELALLRAAEVTLKDGYGYFIIIDANSYIDSSTITIPASYQSTTNLYSYGNAVTATTTTWQTGGGTHTSRHPTHRIKIAAFKSSSEAGKNDGTVYDSQRVKTELFGRYGIGKEGEKNRSKKLATAYYDNYLEAKEVGNNKSVRINLEKAAKYGHAEAQFLLGLMYTDGLRVVKNKQAAMKWFRKAAEQGHVDAQNNLNLLIHHVDR